MADFLLLWCFLDLSYWEEGVWFWKLATFLVIILQNCIIKFVLVSLNFHWKQKFWSLVFLCYLVLKKNWMDSPLFWNFLDFPTPPFASHFPKTDFLSKNCSPCSSWFLSHSSLPSLLSRAKKIELSYLKCPNCSVSCLWSGGTLNKKKWSLSFGIAGSFQMFFFELKLWII